MSGQLIRVSVLIALCVYARAARAQTGGSVDLTWNTIDGGGATFSTGNTYTEGGTIGQPDAGKLSGGSYALSGGFWAGVSASVPPPGPCIGDCSDDRAVTVDELLTMVSIALGHTSVSDCRSGDNQITVAEVITALNNALGECPPR